METAEQNAALAMFPATIGSGYERRDLFYEMHRLYVIVINVILDAQTVTYL